MTTTNEGIIRDFIAAWSRLNTEELVAYFCEDGVYHNMPADSVSGHEALTGFIGAFLAGWDKTDWEILNLVQKESTLGGKQLEIHSTNLTTLPGSTTAYPATCISGAAG